MEASLAPWRQVGTSGGLHGYVLTMTKRIWNCFQIFFLMVGHFTQKLYIFDGFWWVKIRIAMVSSGEKIRWMARSSTVAGERRNAGLHLSDAGRSQENLADLAKRSTEPNWPGFKKIGFTWRNLGQWIGFKENLQENPIFNGKIYGFRFWFSLKPIHWLGQNFQFSWLILRKPQRKLPALGFQKPHLKRSQKLAGTFRNIERFFRLQLDTYTWGCWQMGYRAPTTLVNYLWILTWLYELHNHFCHLLQWFWHRRDPPTGTGLLSGSTLYASRMPHQHFVGVSGAQGTMEWIFGRICSRHPQMFGAQNV